MRQNLDFSDYDFTQVPLDRIVGLGQRTMLYSDLFTVSWLLGRYCNYRCSYCWPYARSDKKDHRPTGLILKTMDEIKRQAREKDFNSFHFSFSGGEPTFHPGFLEIIDHYSSDTPQANYQSLHMTSNCSRPLKWWEAFAQRSSALHRVSVTASWHTEAGAKNPQKHREQFAEKLIFAQEQDIQVTINMVMVPERFDELMKDAVYFHDRNINVTLKPQSDLRAARVVEGYTSEMRKILANGLPQRSYTEQTLKDKGRTSKRPDDMFKKRLKQQMASVSPGSHVPMSFQVELRDEEGKPWFFDQAERFNAFDFNRFKGWDCSSGYRSIIIREPDGSIKRSYSCADMPLGNIETGFKLFDSIRPCKTETCVSSADSKIPKRKPGASFELFKTLASEEKD